MEPCWGRREKHMVKKGEWVERLESWCTVGSGVAVRRKAEWKPDVRNHAIFL